MSVKWLQELWLQGRTRVPFDDWVTFQIQRGEAWRASHFEPLLLENESLEVLLRIGDNAPSIVPHIHVEGNALWYAYEDFDYDDEGTPVPVANFKRSALDGEKSSIALFANPNVTRYGFGFGPVFIPAGDIKGGCGLMYSPRWEIVLGKNYETLFRVQNISKQDVAMYFELDWYHSHFIDARTGAPVD